MSVVMKFGGTSVGSADAIAHVAQIIKDRLTQKPVVVVSAVTKMTDALIRLAQEAATGGGDETLVFIRNTHEQIVKELKLPSSLLAEDFSELEALIYRTRAKKLSNKKTLDHFQSFGERMCTKILAAQLIKIGVASKSFPAWEIGMVTNSVHGDAEPLSSSYALIKKKIARLKGVPVITGYIGKTEGGDIVTFGRGGSDYTAAIIGAAIGAEKIQIWKEVDGILTTDPRLVKNARIVRELAFEEASELAYFGAKVLHPKAIVPAMRKKIPVQVLNTFHPKEKGTTIVSTFADKSNKSTSIEALTFRKHVTVVHIGSPEFFDGSGDMAKLFTIFEKYKTNIGVIATSIASVSVTVDDDEYLEKIVAELKKLGEVTVEKGKAIVCAVGGSVDAASIIGRMFTVLGKNNIAVEMISQASSGVSITFVVADSEAENTVKILHSEYIG